MKGSEEVNVSTLAWVDKTSRYDVHRSNNMNERCSGNNRISDVL